MEANQKSQIRDIKSQMWSNEMYLSIFRLKLEKYKMQNNITLPSPKLK